jgi:hypothetical protein
MPEPSKPLLFSLYLEHTPSPNDPVGASEFYQALGILVMAFGRLESHFLTCILHILQTPATSGLSTKLPQAWSEHAKIWKAAFRTSPALNLHKKDALNFLTEMQDVADYRNRIIHGLWEGFNIGLPLSAMNVSIKHKKGTTDGIELRRTIIALDQVIAVARKASRLNIELISLSSILEAERGRPPSDIHIF